MSHADQVRKHARWRPGWHAGRRSFAWLLPLSDPPNLRQLVNQYQYALRDLPGFDLVPLEWMHILVQDAGFTDQVTPDQIDPLVESARRALATVSPLTLAFQNAVVLPESLALPAEPQSTLAELRSTMRAATAEAVGTTDLPSEPEQTDQHVSLAYSTAEGPAVFAKATLGGTTVEPITVKIPSVSLVRLNRDHSCSEWETVAEVPFGG